MIGHVVSTELVTARACRVVVGSGGLRGLVPDDRVARHVKLVLPAPPGTVRSPTRTLTVRELVPDVHGFAVEVVLHDGGIAGGWALGARPGDPVGLVGPSGGHRVRRDLGRYVLAGDETALPAIAGIVGALAPDQQAEVLIEVEEALDRRPLPARENVRVRWLHRRGCPYGELLEQAFHELAIAPGETFVWGAGEAAALRRLRRHVRDDLGVPRTDFEIGGYWVQRLSEDEGVARNRAAWEAALAAGKSEAEIEDALLY